MYGDVPLTVLVGKITEVGYDSITVERTTRVRLPADVESGHLTIGTRVMVRARRIKGEYIAETVVPEKEIA
jgi:hypothetical protein